MKDIEGGRSFPVKDVFGARFSKWRFSLVKVIRSGLFLRWKVFSVKHVLGEDVLCRGFVLGGRYSW